MTHSAINKTVFVAGGAGGSKGIGKGIVHALAAAGFDVSFSFRSSPEDAAQLVSSLTEKYPSQTFQHYQVDLSEREQVDAFAETIKNSTDLYGLVYNAGGTYDTLAAMVDQDRAEALFQLNFWAMTRLAGAAVQPLIHAKNGRIVAVGSITAQLGVQGNSIYAASKGAMLSYIRTLAVELARRGVTANCIAPGFIDTDLMAPYEDHRHDVEKKIPLGRYGRSDEVGALTRFLFSPLAGYITGAVIPIDGGFSAGLSNRG